MDLEKEKALMASVDPAVIHRIKQEAWSMAMSIKYGNEMLAPVFQSKPKDLCVEHSADRRVLAEVAGRIAAQLILKHIDESAYWEKVGMTDGGNWASLVERNPVNND